MMKNLNFCSHRRSAVASGLTTRQWGLELPLQETAVGASKPTQGKKEDGK